MSDVNGAPPWRPTFAELALRARTAIVAGGSCRPAGPAGNADVSAPSIPSVFGSLPAPADGWLTLDDLTARLSDRSTGWSRAMLDQQLLALVSWPDLTRWPHLEVQSLARICALLSRKPTVGFLVPRVLALPAPQTQTQLLLLYANGCLRVVRSDVPLAEPDPTTPEVVEPVRHVGATPVMNTSFLGKLWLRLTSRRQPA